MHGADVNKEKREFYVWKDEKSVDLTECLLDEIGEASYQVFLNSMVMNSDVNKVAQCNRSCAQGFFKM